MAETSLVVRNSKGNGNSSLTFIFIVWGHPRIPRVSKKMDASCRRKSNNGKRIRKRTRPIRSIVLEDETLCTVSGESLVFLGRPGPLFVRLLHWWFSTRFPRYQKRSILQELVEVVCNTHFQLSSLSFLNLALLLDSFYRRFLIMCYISNVAS